MDQAQTSHAGGAGLLVVLILLCLYFFPSVIAIVRKHRQAVAISILNLLLGWTCLFWIIALVWAFTNSQPAQTVVVNNGSGSNL